MPVFVCQTVCYLLVTNVTQIWYFKLLKSPGIDSKESVPPAYVAWRAGMATLFLLGS
jgi:hypothetical protein